MTRGNVKSLTKALDILELFISTKREMALSEISISLNLHKATVKRIISTLSERGYIYQREKRGKYFLGTMCLNLSEVVKGKIKIRNVALPYVIKLGNELNEDVILYTLNGRNNITTEIFPPTTKPGHTLRVIPDEAAGSSLYSKAAGKIILANYSETELDNYFENQQVIKRTPKTITGIFQIKEHLATVQKEGIAYDDEENTPGVRAVAAGIRNSEGQLVGSICVFAPSLRLSKPKMRTLAAVVKKYALQISSNLGNSP